MSAVPGAFAKRYRCPCCNNPWNQSNDAESAAGSGELEAYFCTPCLSDDKGYTGIDPINFDANVRLKDNFYRWSNGGWMEKNPIPAAYSSWNTFIVLRDMNLERLKGILDDMSQTADSSGQAPNIGEQKLADFFNAFMDEKCIEERGVSVLSDMAVICSAANADPTAAIAKLHAQFGVSVFFGKYASPDKCNSEHSLCNLSQGGLGLPDRDYYFDGGDKLVKRAKYVEYITTLLSLLGKQQHGELFPQYADKTRCEKIALGILGFETSLAAMHLTRTESRDPQLTYNKMSVAQLSDKSKPVQSWSQYLATGTAAARGFDWFAYFDLIGKSAAAMGDVNVSAVTALTQFSNLLTAPLLQHYLLFHCVNSYASHLPNAFCEAHFQFFEKELKGTAEQLPRWKRALQGLESAMGEELGQLYVKKYFPSDAKARALEIVEAVRDALRQRLQEVDWMSAETREEALKKMEKFKVKIGFPDKWIDYSDLQVNKGTHMENVIAARQFASRLELSRMNTATDRGRWYMTPQTVNAYYHPSLNEIVFPAAILQPPFFDAAADKAVQFGSLGAVVGHEMTHGFDDQGRKYDSAGNLRDWWAHGDGAEYDKRASVMIKQAEQFEVHGLKLNGKLTCGENIADLGGVKLALRALKQQLAVEKRAQEAAGVADWKPPLINGFTPAQRLFLAWSQAWRENAKKERAMQLVTLDPHGPNELRCNGTLKNVPEFLEEFSIAEGDPMFLARGSQVDIW